MDQKKRHNRKVVVDTIENHRQSRWSVPQLVVVTLWCILQLASTALFVIGDVFQENAPRFPLIPTVVSAILSSTMCAVATAVLGRSIYKNGSFKFYQPFAGGNLFVFLQALGYFLLTTAGVVTSGYVALSTGGRSVRFGVLIIGGLTSMVANLTLFVSLFLFDPWSGLHKHQANLVALLQPLRLSPNRETTLVALFTVAQMFLCGIAESFPIVGGVVALVVLSFHIITGVLVHFVIGFKHTPRYRLFMPFPGTRLQAVSQFVVWVLYATTVYGAIFLVVARDRAPPLAHVALGCGCFASSITFLLFVRLANINETNCTTHSQLSTYGCAVGTIASSMQCSVVLLLTAFLKVYNVSQSSQLGKGLLFCQQMSCLLLFVIPPCTHFVGRIQYGEVYKLFQPFQGGLDFVMLQGAGWSCYGVALFFGTLQVTADDFHWIFAEAVAALFAQIFVHLSLRLFKGTSCSVSLRKLHQAGPSTPLGPAFPTALSYLNGELLTSFLLLVCAIILRVIVDIASYGHDPRVSREVLLLIATVLYACSTPLAHLSGANFGIPLFRPFEGSGMYVALQSIGWTIYATFLLATLFSWIADSAGVLISGPIAIPLLSTSYGLAQLIPTVLVAVSVYIEADQHSKIADQAFKMREALGKMDDIEGTLHGLDVEAKEKIAAVFAEIKRASGAVHTTELNSARHNDKSSRKQAVSLIVLLMSFASVSCFTVGSFWTGSLPVFGVGFATAGLAITTTSCVALHTLYGDSVHGETGRYTFLMPFVGGTTFVLYQALGWGSYTFCAILTIACAIERRGNAIALLTAGAASLVAQFVVLHSISKFDATPRRSFLQQNSAAIVASCTFFASFVFAHLYGRFREQLFSPGYSSNSEDDPLIPKQHMVPLVVSAVSMTFAIPLTLVAMKRRSTIPDTTLSGSDTSEGGAGTFAQNISKGRRIIRDTIVAVDSIVFALTYLVPVVILYLLHYVFHNFAPGAIRIASNWDSIMLAMGILLLVSLLPSFLTSNVSLPEWARRTREAFLTFQVYLIPTHASILSYSMPFIFPDSLAARYFAIAMSLLTVGAHNRFVRTAVLRLSYVLLGYLTYQHCSECFATGNYLFGRLLVDVMLLVFWVKYETQFKHKPQETGILRSPKFINFVKKYVFADVERYFSFKLFVEKGNGGEGVCLKSPNKKFIFSYHPHGIFPGTALILPMTSQWEKLIGSNDVNHVSVHAASIIFNVPMVRDFLLRLGGRVVTRTSLEGSLTEGNSVMIVTGGQSEMLWTKISDTEMHLVTHHHGFIRLAVKHQVPLVPVICFAEHNVMDNVHIDWLQRKMLKLIGFPFPTVPHGRWYLPVPNRTPLSVVVGSPVNPPEGLHPDDSDGIAALSKTYFSEIHRIFYKHREECGYPNMELILHDK